MKKNLLYGLGDQAEAVPEVVELRGGVGEVGGQAQEPEPNPVQPPLVAVTTLSTADSCSRMRSGGTVRSFSVPSWA